MRRMRKDAKPLSLFLLVSTITRPTKWKKLSRLFFFLAGLVVVHLFPSYYLDEEKLRRHSVTPPTGFDACSSARSLTEFLEVRHNSYPDKKKISNTNPICLNSAYNSIHVAVPFHNLDEVALNIAVQSVVSQHYPRDKINIWVYDDGSNLALSNAVLDYVCGDRVVNFVPTSDLSTSLDHVIEEVNNMFHSNWYNRLVCFRSTQHLGPGGGKYWLLKLIQKKSKPNDVVLILDGDDSLLDDRALQIVNQHYIDYGSWFTYGSYDGKWSHQTKNLSSSVKSGEQEFRPRAGEWIYGHPRTFKAHLLSHLKPADFQHSDGTWLLKASDRGYVYRLLELSGPRKISYIPKKIYRYNFSPGSSTLSLVPPDIRQDHLNHTQNMLPSQQLKLDLNVVLLVWKRTYLLKSQLFWLQKQSGLNGRRIHVHLINNNPRKKATVNDTVKQFKDAKKKQLPPIKVSVIHSGNENKYCFARFAHVAKLRDEIPIDHVVFLDDDQYWPENFLSSLLNEHKPKSMSTWYGKLFDNDEHGIANYWKPSFTMTQINHGKLWPEVSSFKYGGPGGSILDANLWLNSQLMRLDGDLSHWAKIDDLWVSFVLDALLGWEIRRLPPSVMPVDIGDFREIKSYRDLVSKKLSVETQNDLMQLRSLSGADNVRKAATWMDPTVDKQNVFLSLQEDFMWDVNT